MGTNTGVWPVNPATDTGFFRIEIGDSAPTNTPIDSDTEAEYEFFGDAYLTTLLAKYPDDPDEAMASALDTMARRLIIEAQSIQVDDIKLATEKRAQLFSEHAAQIRQFGVQRTSDNFTVTSSHVTQYTTQSPNWYPAGYDRFGDVG